MADRNHIPKAERDPLMLAVGAELRDTRERLGLSRADVSALLDGHTREPVGERAILSYEVAGRGLLVARLRDLGEAYGVPGSRILRRAEVRADVPLVCRACERPW